MTRTVLFVCPHGAGMSRMAAGWFNLVAPPERVIGLCCDVEGGERWDLVHREFTEAMRAVVYQESVAVRQ